jgi:hypothetical protein
MHWRACLPCEREMLCLVQVALPHAQVPTEAQRSSAQSTTTDSLAAIAVSTGVRARKRIQSSARKSERRPEPTE